jgi:hypothetical protein
MLHIHSQHQVACSFCPCPFTGPLFLVEYIPEPKNPSSRPQSTKPPNRTSDMHLTQGYAGK